MEICTQKRKSTYYGILEILTDKVISAVCFNESFACENNVTKMHVNITNLMIDAFDAFSCSTTMNKMNFILLFNLKCNTYIVS